VTLRRDDLARAAGERFETRAERLAGLEREIRQTQAEALGRLGERLQRLLEALAAADRRLDAMQATGRALDAGAATTLHAETAARNRVRDEAARLRHHLIIQREALGLARHGPVDQCYPVPGRRRLPGGPAREEGTP
jgi:uncharacterized protein YbaP (TraB family)